MSLGCPQVSARVQAAIGALQPTDARRTPAAFPDSARSATAWSRTIRTRHVLISFGQIMDELFTFPLA